MFDDLQGRVRHVLKATGSYWHHAAALPYSASRPAGRKNKRVRLPLHHPALVASRVPAQAGVATGSVCFQLLSSLNTCPALPPSIAAVVSTPPISAPPTPAVTTSWPVR